MFSSVAESAVWRLLSFCTLRKAGTAVDPAGEPRNETEPKATEGRKPQRPSKATSLWLQALHAPFWTLWNIQKNATYYNFLFSFSINLYRKIPLTTKHQNIKYFFPCRSKLKFCFPPVLHPDISGELRFNRIIVFLIHRVRLLAGRNCGLKEFASGLTNLVATDGPILQLFISFRK